MQLQHIGKWLPVEQIPEFEVLGQHEGIALGVLQTTPRQNNTERSLCEPCNQHAE
jgi:hypothetical protein